MLSELALTGMAQQLAEHCLLKAVEDNVVTLWLDQDGVNLQTSHTEAQLAEALSSFLGRRVRVMLEPCALTAETPGQRRLRLTEAKQLQAEQSLQEDDFVRGLQERFGAIIVPGSVRTSDSQ